MVLLLWIICVISVLFLLCFHARLFVDALWSPAGRGLTSWLSFVMSNCDVVSILGRVWCMVVYITDLCPFSYFNSKSIMPLKQIALSTQQRYIRQEIRHTRSYLFHMLLFLCLCQDFSFFFFEHRATKINLLWKLPLQKWKVV